MLALWLLFVAPFVPFRTRWPGVGVGERVSAGDNPQSPDANSSVLIESDLSFMSIRTRATTGEGEVRAVLLLGNVA